MLLVLAFYRVFFCDMEQVVIPVIPVNILQIKAERFTVTNSFRIALAHQQRIIDFLAGTHQTISQRFVQFVHSPFNVGSRELIHRTGIGVAVQFAQLSPENVLQQNMVLAPPLFLAVFRRNIDISELL